MKLLLTSNGFSNPSIIKALQDLVQKPFSELNFAFIPTATTQEDEDKTWLANDIYRASQLGFKKFDIVNIDAISNGDVKTRLEKADVLMFGGGDTFYLRDWIRKTGLEELLPEWLKTKVYIGLSAGSMVTNPNLHLQNLRNLYYEKVTSNDESALNFVNFFIRPHYKAPHFPDVIDSNLEKWSKEVSQTIYAIDDMSAVKVEGDKVEVISEGEWKKFN